MQNYTSLVYDYNSKYDFIKKSNVIHINEIMYINDSKLFLINLNKKYYDRYSKITSFWSLEILTLQKAYFSYKLKQLRKSFYLPYAANVQLKNKSLIFFLHSFMKEDLFLIPHLIYFFIVSTLRNLKIESVSSLNFFLSDKKVFYNIGDFYLFLKNKKVKKNTLWLSLYKIIL